VASEPERARSSVILGCLCCCVLVWDNTAGVDAEDRVGAGAKFCIKVVLSLNCRRTRLRIGFGGGGSFLCVGKAVAGGFCGKVDDFRG